MSVEELKQRQGAMWGSGPFERIATTVSDVHERVEYWQLFSTSFGPVKTLGESLELEQREVSRGAFADLYESNFREGDEIVQPREYLLTLGVRR